MEEPTSEMELTNTMEEESTTETKMINTTEEEPSRLHQQEQSGYGGSKEKKSDTPEQACNEGGICGTVDLLSHRNAFLERVLVNLTSTYNQARRSFTEDISALLKVQVERANQEIVDMKGCVGRQEDVRRTYILLNELDEEIIKVTAFINLYEARGTTGVLQSNQTNPGSLQYIIRPAGSASRRCRFQNCRSDDHFSSGCHNLKPENISSNIQQLCLDAEVCLRCLRDRSCRYHDETCTGSYRRKSDNRPVNTDCSMCTVMFPGGKVVRVNRRICQHALNEVKANRAPTPPPQESNRCFSYFSK